MKNVFLSLVYSKSTVCDRTYKKCVNQLFVLLVRLLANSSASKVFGKSKVNMWIFDCVCVGGWGCHHPNPGVVKGL